ncbi:MAG TPA: DUF192 domain-containing protein [Nitrososphaera sp.]|jgi:uncharacterized membrane protein (UPF0127 family)|nr:DUF192 domain-containing protein [Nitrososphaera sp.]
MAIPFVIFFAVAIAIGAIITVAVLYFNPAAITTSILGQTEDEQQELTISQQLRSVSYGYRQVNVTMNGLVLVADIAATDEQRTKGLSVKDRLGENEAMLFVFDNEAEHSFWMKNMKFPIDIIWLDSDKTIVHIEHNLQPCSFELLCPTYKPNVESLYVLETVGGFAEKYDIVKGTMVEFDLTA